MDIAQPRSAVGPGRQDQQDDRCRLWAMPMNLTVSYLHHQTTFGRSGEPPFAPPPGMFSRQFIGFSISLPLLSLAGLQS